ncbi:MAG: PilZ domain-containing protein [Planctomycetota bacterium]|jgi:hypothetical protein
MLHDALTSGSGKPRSPNDRRRSARPPALAAELVVLWHHDMETAIRYPLVDLTGDGVRILTAAPLVEGMTGTAVHLLPKGNRINRPCTVCWVRPRARSRAYEAKPTLARRPKQAAFNAVDGG